MTWPTNTGGRAETCVPMPAALQINVAARVRAHTPSLIYSLRERGRRELAGMPQVR